MMRPRVLVVEDELQMSMILKDNLEFEGYDVLSASTGEEALDLASRERPDLVLLDVMLPRLSGYDVCRKLSRMAERLPIIMITARNSEHDRIAGLEMGADDYVAKPFSIGELLARVRVQLRRSRPAGSVAGRSVSLGDVVLDLDRREGCRGPKRLDISAREWDLLEYLFDRRGQTVSRDQLLGDVWGHQGLTLTRTIDNFIARLRRKLEPNPHQPRYIRTIHGIGYRLQV